MREALKSLFTVVGGCILGVLAALLAVSWSVSRGEMPPGAGFILVLVVGSGGIAGAVIAAYWPQKKRQSK